MAYEKQNFKDDEVLTAEQLNHMDEGIGNATPFIVTLSDDKSTASHTLAQILEEANKGRLVLLKEFNSEEACAPFMLKYVDPTYALFYQATDDPALYFYTLDEDGAVVYDEYYLADANLVTEIAPLIVKLRNSNKTANFTAKQIYDYMFNSSASNAKLQYNDGVRNYVLMLEHCTPGLAQFIWTEEDNQTEHVIVIDGSGNVEIYENPDVGSTPNSLTVDEITCRSNATFEGSFSVGDWGGNVVGLEVRDPEETEDPDNPNPYGVLAFMEVIADNMVRLRNVAPGVYDADAVNVGQLNNAVGDIETALDSIIAIQNSLIGGESA